MSLTLLKQKLSPKRLRQLTLLCMVFPLLLIIFVFQYVPVLGWVYAFFDYRPGSQLTAENFVGFANFAKLFSSNSNFLQALVNTLAISALNLLFSLVPPIFAIFLSEVRCSPFRRLVQSMTTMPYFISWIIVYSLAMSIFGTEGFLYNIFRMFGFTGDWANPLGNKEFAWLFQALIYLWKSFGWNSIIYMAAIAGLDAQLYEAAKVDGAGRLQSILYVTLPGLAPTYLVLTMIQISNMLNNGFEQFFVFSNPLVSSKLQVIDLYVYNIGLKNGDFAFATAVGISKTLVSLLLLGGVNMVTKKIRGSSIF